LFGKVGVDSSGWEDDRGERGWGDEKRAFEVNTVQRRRGRTIEEREEDGVTRKGRRGQHCEGRDGEGE
jgi:hypothetical protein